jgi:LmbE family N-acetylglucosaminyl deacetylase
MSRMRVSGLPRTLYTRSRTLRRDLADRRFAPRLRHDPAAPELVLSPHLDDAVLDCWGVLAGPGEVTVVNIFAGAPEPGHVTLWDAITGARDSAERVRERIAEDAAALARAGRRPHNLTLLDAQYRKPPPLRLDDLDALLVAKVPSASRVHTTAGIGAHPDHVLARRYAVALLRAGVPVTLCAELPYCVYHGWPHWVDGREPEPHRNIDPFWAQFLGDVPELPPLRDARVRRLDDDASRAKLGAMETYATQFASLSYGGRDMLADPEIHRFEVGWDLVAHGAPAAHAAQPRGAEQVPAGGATR